MRLSVRSNSSEAKASPRRTFGGHAGTPVEVRQEAPGELVFERIDHREGGAEEGDVVVDAAARLVEAKASFERFVGVARRRTDGGQESEGSHVGRPCRNRTAGPAGRQFS